ncbi:neurotrimin-like [Oppia nitens]|uniref:neurotrimin-like n=1 Tax=Oppia nitens TaxID=1686743 RepID=UPI0023D9D939|nr:neurotrimin-like [Oppia nitens]
MLPVLPLLLAQPISDTNDEKLPEFDGQILSEPLKPGVGTDVTLSCPIKNLGKYKISWNSVDKQTLLVVQNYVISDNPRIGFKKVSKGDISYWSLIIRNVTLSDSGYYICQIDTNPPIRLLKFLNIFVPVQFDNKFSVESDSVIRVRELHNVSLTCKATGNPKPTITWRRQDGRLLQLGNGSVTESVESEVLNLQEINRSVIGYYVCIASNQLSPSLRRKTFLDIEFSPTIRVPNKIVSSFVGHNVTIECITESNPKAEHFWIDVSGNQITPMKSNNYIITIINSNKFKVHFKLTIINVDYINAGRYTCLSTNRLGSIKSSIVVDGNVSLL